MPVPLVARRTERTHCGAWALLGIGHIGAVRRGVGGEPRYTGPIADSVECLREPEHDGWHEAEVRPVADLYGGGDVGIRWRRATDLLARDNVVQVVLLKPLPAGWA